MPLGAPAAATLAGRPFAPAPAFVLAQTAVHPTLFLAPRPLHCAAALTRVRHPPPRRPARCLMSVSSSLPRRPDHLHAASFGNDANMGACMQATISSGERKPGFR